MTAYDVYTSASSLSGKVDSELYSFGDRLDDLVAGRYTFLKKAVSAVRRGFGAVVGRLDDRLTFGRYNDDESTFLRRARKYDMENLVNSGFRRLCGLTERYGIHNFEDANRYLHKLRDRILSESSAIDVMDLSRDYLSIIDDCRYMERAGGAADIMKKFHEERGSMVGKFVDRGQKMSARVSAPDRGRQMEMMRKLESAESMGLNRTQGVKR